MCDLQLRNVINFFRTPFQVLLDSMKMPLSQYSIHMPVEGSGCWMWLERGIRVSQVGCPGKAA